MQISDGNWVCKFFRWFIKKKSRTPRPLLISRYPGKIFVLKFIPNQSDLFRNLYPSQFEPIRVNPKKKFNLVWCKSVENLSDLIRVNPNKSEQFLNPDESEVGIIRTDSDWEFSLNPSDLEFIRIKNFFQIDSDWKSRIKSD